MLGFKFETIIDGSSRFDLMDLIFFFINSQMLSIETSCGNFSSPFFQFTELCGSFLHFKRSAQTLMATVLRKAIWNWIEVFPAEFVTLCQSQKRLDGGAEILFDYCNNLAADKDIKKKNVFWPLQTMLLI